MATMINPTRMNLINLKKRTVIARKGHSILKRKREVLVIEFLKLLKESKESRSALNEIIKNSYRTVAIASAYVGNFELEVHPVAFRERLCSHYRAQALGILGLCISPV